MHSGVDEYACITECILLSAKWLMYCSSLGKTMARQCVIFYTATEQKRDKNISIRPLGRYMAVVSCTTPLVSYCRLHQRIYN